MYWWDVRALAEDLQQDRVTQAEQFKYVMAYSVAYWVLTFLEIGHKDLGVCDVVCLVAQLLITIVGVWFCRRANRSGDDRDFMVRFFSLAWPLGVKFCVLGGVLILLILRMVYPVLGPGVMRNEITPIIFGIALWIGYFWRLHYWIKRVAQAAVPPV